ncbi:MAG TPA: RNA 2',3'-cyclic phosphodiesterase [Fibrobacteria bacterium]|nr:RNA 2',3'-cyclic phosphodiesterase [Fibrobacteria bacterium]
MPRLFIAVDLPETVRDRLAEIAAGLPGADWIESERYHLTLRFIGETDPDTFQAVRKSLGSVLTRSFYLSLRGVGLFPLRGDPDTLWAGVPRNEDLLRLRHKVESALARNGVPPDTRKFFPHVTLARVRECREEWVGRYVADHGLFSIPEFPVQGFGLFSSKLTPEGAVHTLEEAYPLEGILEAE